MSKALSQSENIVRAKALLLGRQSLWSAESAKKGANSRGA